MERMIGHLIGRALREIVKRDISGKVRSNSLTEKALIEFFGLNDKPGITDRDLMEGQVAIMKKMLAYSEWLERKKAYEEFTGRRWR